MTEKILVRVISKVIIANETIETDDNEMAS